MIISLITTSTLKSSINGKPEKIAELTAYAFGLSNCKKIPDKIDGFLFFMKLIFESENAIL